MDETVVDENSKSEILYDEEFQQAILNLVINYSLQKSVHMPMLVAKKEVAGYLHSVASILTNTDTETKE